jgi:hypothetical protein
MKHNLFFTRMLLVVSAVFCSLILSVSVTAAVPQKMEGALVIAPMSGLKQIAVESVKDTLNACLARIPLDASAGQHMLAEQNCQQVDVQRQEGTQLTF